MASQLEIAVGTQLRACQSWLQGQIVGPASGQESDWVRQNYGLSARERVEIYQGMYPMRMVEALQTDYPGVQAALGEKRFAQLVSDYIEVHPSKSWTLNRLGDHFPQFIRQGRLRHRRFLGELAQLEQALCQVFDAPEVAALAPPQQLPEFLGLRPTSRLLDFHYPVSDYLHQVDSGLRPARPAPSRQFLLISRRQFQMQRRPISEPAWRLLGQLQQGQSLVKALIRWGHRYPQLPPDTLSRWFAEWTEWEVFRA